jgi:hypothetical protein
MTGDPKADKDVDRTATTWPAMMGWSLKQEIGYIVGDFFIHMSRDIAGQYWLEPVSTADFFARSRIQKHLNSRVNWTDKNMYEVLMSYIEKSRASV